MPQHIGPKPWWLLLVGGVLLACESPEPSHDSPAQTYQTYVQAVTDDDPRQVWMCFSRGYQELLYHSNLQQWLTAWEQERGARRAAVARLQIRTVTQINQHLGYVQFAASTVKVGESPFFYFLHQDDGWKITSHLDASFRQALEKALVQGDYDLPQQR